MVRFLSKSASSLTRQPRKRSSVAHIKEASNSNWTLTFTCSFLRVPQTPRPLANRSPSKQSWNFQRLSNTNALCQSLVPSLHVYLLAFNTEAQDYHFLVDPIDSTTLTLTDCRIRQLEQLINQKHQRCRSGGSTGNLFFSAYRCDIIANPWGFCRIKILKQTS